MVTVSNDSDNEAPKRLDSSDYLSEFAQVSLPVLMEICKKGGRYTEGALDTLRPSFKVFVAYIKKKLYLYKL